MCYLYQAMYYIYVSLVFFKSNLFNLYKYNFLAKQCWIRSSRKFSIASTVLCLNISVLTDCTNFGKTIVWASIWNTFDLDHMLKYMYLYLVWIQIVSINLKVVFSLIRVYCSFHVSLSKAFLGFFFTETVVMCVNVFYITRNKISAGSDKKWEISP